MSNEILTYLHDGIELTSEDWTNSTHSFGDLVRIIGSTHDAAQTAAVKAINRMQTMRNWLIGYYIVEYEQHGEDRAAYGEQLLKRLEQRINKKGLTERRFREFRKVYLTYPQLAAPVMEYLDIHAVEIRRTLAAELQTIENGGVLLTNQLCRTILHQ